MGLDGEGVQEHYAVKSKQGMGAGGGSRSQEASELAFWALRAQLIKTHCTYEAWLRVGTAPEKWTDSGRTDSRAEE